MPRGIIIFGSSGSGKTTLGKMVAERLSFPYFDLDDYVWRRDTDKPFTVMYTREEKINRLMSDIYQSEFFVMAGSMDSFNTPFVPLFDLAVHITASVVARLARINKGEYERFGKRVLEGGDLYENHQRFLDRSARYDLAGSCSMKTHEEWANSLPCKVIRINGENSLSNSMELIINVYRELIY
jgi:hypothetical protein